MQCISTSLIHLSHFVYVICIAFDESFNEQFVLAEAGSGCFEKTVGEITTNIVHRSQTNRLWNINQHSFWIMHRLNLSTFNQWSTNYIWTFSNAFIWIKNCFDLFCFVSVFVFFLLLLLRANFFRSCYNWMCRRFFKCKITR